MNGIDDKFSKKPKVSDFHQQSLPSWNPLILISTIFPLFGSVGLCFIIIGIALLLSSKSVNEFRYDYTDCREYNSTSRNFSANLCSTMLDRNMTSNYLTCKCKIDFDLKPKFEGQVFFYYLLRHFYQNHRRYFGSRDDKQLAGQSRETVSSSCNPIGSEKNGTVKLNYAPCGLIANSLFNDTFELFYGNDSNAIPVTMTSEGIAWKSDVNLLFGTPPDWKKTLKPINWKYTALERNNHSYKQDEELIVWMRTAPLSTFKKLHRIILHDREPFKGGLPAGKYQLVINYAYPVSGFGGNKIFVLGTTNAMGGKNNNMGIMYVALGTLHNVIAIVFLLVTLFRRTREHSFSDTPLIMLPLSPESYGMKEPSYINVGSTTKK